MDLRISIVIPIYNVEAYLHQCVDSVLNQTYQNIEVILVDDGSPDKSPAICDVYSQKDKRVVVIHKQNRGLSDARNEGLKRATGDYVIFLDSDDYYKYDDFLEKIVDATDEGKKDAVFFQRTVFYDGSNRPNYNYPPFRLEWNRLDASTLLLELAKNDLLDASACMKATKRSILQGNDLFFRNGIYCEDIEWFSRYIMFINSIALIDNPDYFYRKREGSITSKLKEKNVRDLFYTIQHHSEKIRRSGTDDNRVRAILSYHSYQFYIILGLTNNTVKGKVRSQLLNECKRYKWLSDYSISGKTRKSAAILRIFGIKIASRILGTYIRRK